MNYVFLSPHNDDAELWGAFTLLRHNPLVIVCLRSHLQEQRGTGITSDQREQETEHALAELGVTEWRQWSTLDSSEEWSMRDALIKSLIEVNETVPAAHVFAPCEEEDGHWQHNLIGSLALDVFGEERVTRYLTYTSSRGRSDWGFEVPYEPHWPAMKLRALSCYRSQIMEPSTRPHFMGGIREYVAT